MQLEFGHSSCRNVFQCACKDHGIGLQLDVISGMLFHTMVSRCKSWKKIGDIGWVRCAGFIKMRIPGGRHLEPENVQLKFGH